MHLGKTSTPFAQQQARPPEILFSACAVVHSDIANNSWEEKPHLTSAF